ncbi:hypothetical protein JCM10908_002714 [Rhodotorula pacifica]|uniref:uncharacterized protein n=1 Tax=Rhodotorula pacifica TaxID=1495444 RepID=UPI003180BF8D
MPSSPDSRRHSTASLSDDQVFFASRRASDTGYAYDGAPTYDLSASQSDTDAAGPATRTGSAMSPTSSRTSAPHPDTVSLSTHEVDQAETPVHAPTSNRSRARAFSFLSVHPAMSAPALRTPGLSPALSFASDTPFVGGSYDSALDDAEDEDADSVLDLDANDDVGGQHRNAGGRTDRSSFAMTGLGHATGSEGRTSYRTRFQPLDSLELAWMTVSAVAVLALTVGSLVVAFVG